MRLGHTITIASVNKKPGEERASRRGRTKPPEKVIVVILGDKCGILLSEYLPGGTTISDLYYASINGRLCCAILEKCRDKVVLLVVGNAPIDKCNIVQTAIGKGGFVELNDGAYSPNIALSDSYLLSNLFAERI